MKFPITIEDGACDLTAFLAHIKSLHGNYTISVERDGTTRTNQQNRWLWGCIYPLMLKGLIDLGWEFTNTQMVHDFCARFRDDEVLNHNTGEVLHLPASTRDMDTVEMATYCETLRDFAREYINIEIPDPDPEYYGK